MSPMPMPSPLVVEVAQHLPPGRALDLACGTGRNAHWLAGRGWEVTAVDWSEEALAQVRTPKLRLDLEREPLPFADAAFDLVLIIRFLHRPLFDEAERVLKPGGVLITHPKTTGRFAIDPGELEARFAGWETLIRPSVHGAQCVVRRR
jgi:SAM-dependent methyltransferase